MLGTDPHQFANSVDFCRVDADSPLPLRTALEILDRDRLTADDEQAPVRLAKPVVEGGRADRQPTRRFPG